MNFGVADTPLHPQFFRAVTLENLGRSRSTEKHMRIVLMLEGLEGLNTTDKSERFMAATGHHLEDVMATRRTTGIAGEEAGKIVQHPVGFLAALEEIRYAISPARPQQRWTVSQRQLATTFEDPMANLHPPGMYLFHHPVYLPTASGEIQCRPHRRDLSSVFMTVDVHEKHMCTVLGQEAREGRTLKTKFGVSWRRLARVNVAVFLVLLMLVHWLYFKVNSRREVIFRFPC